MWSLCRHYSAANTFPVTCPRLFPLSAAQRSTGRIGLPCMHISVCWPTAFRNGESVSAGFAALAPVGDP